MGWFDDLLGDTIDFFTGDIGNYVEDVVEVILDDPVKAIAQATAYVYAPWAIPIIEGVDIAQNGGDLNDVVEGMAKVYVAKTVGTYTGEYVGSQVAAGTEAAGYSATAAEISGKILGTGTANATAAVVLGQDPVEAFTLGGIGAGVGAGLGQIEGYADLAPYQQTAISTGLTVALSGQDVTPELITASIIQAQATTDIIKGFTTENTNLSENQIGLLANVVQTVATATFTDGTMGISDAILGAIRKKGMSAFEEVFTDTVTGAFDRVTGAYGDLQTTSTKIKQEADAYTNNINAYNSTVKELEPLIAEQNRLYDVMENYRINDNRDPTPDTRRTLNDATNNYNNYVTDLKNKYQPILEGYESAFNTAEANINELQGVYDDQKNKLKGSADALDVALEPIYDVVNQTFVEGIDENFNSDEYVEINDLSEDQDPYFHFLTVGKNQGLYTNLNEYRKTPEGIAEYIAEQSEITTEPFGSVEEAASYVADQAKIAQGVEDEVYARAQAEIAPEDEGEPPDPNMAKEMKYITDIIKRGKALPLQEGFEEFTEVQDPNDPDLQQTDPFLEDYLDQIDEQGEDFYGKDDTEFMAGDQGGPGSTLGVLGGKPVKVSNLVDKATKKRNVLSKGELGTFAIPRMGQPEAELKEVQLVERGPAYDFSSIFRNPEQELRYRSPYSTNEELLKLIRG